MSIVTVVPDVTWIYNTVEESANLSKTSYSPTSVIVIPAAPVPVKTFKVPLIAITLILVL